MSGYNTFAVWGAGNQGAAIVEELLALKPAGRLSSVTVLTRAVQHFAFVTWSRFSHLCAQESKDSEKNKELAAKGAIVLPYDVNGADAASALKGIDVLISGAGAYGKVHQPALLRAAYAAGVKLFLPAEFGDAYKGRDVYPYKEMNELQAQAAALGMPTVSICNGP
jgi:uncharacterized protein YbjT (DUF2867 family)